MFLIRIKNALNDLPASIDEEKFLFPQQKTFKHPVGNGHDFDPHLDL